MDELENHLLTIESMQKEKRLGMTKPLADNIQLDFDFMFFFSSRNV
jgi:hypothetical protein